VNFKIKGQMLIRYTLLILVLTGFTFLELKSQNDLERADKFFAMNDMEVALNLYQGLLDKQTEESNALSGMARCYLRLNKYERALHYFKRYYAMVPNDQELLIEYGLVLMGLSLYQEAIEVFNRIENKHYEKARQMLASCQFALEHSAEEMQYRVSLLPLSGSDFDFYALPVEGHLLFLTVREDREISRGPFVDYSKPRIFKAEIGEKVYFSKALNSNISGDFGPFAFSPSDRRVALTKNNFQTQQRLMGDNLLNMSLHLGRWDEKGGGFVDLYGFPYNEPGVSNGLACFSEDGKTLYFTSNRPGGYGGFDLYKTVFINGRWSTPVNLGPDVNTPGDEISPIVRNQKLYFASDYHKGFGGFDIFESILKGGEWTEVLNLGLPINSAYDEYSYWFDAENNFGYLTSNRKGGKGGSDIYHVNKMTKKVNIHVKDENNDEPIAGVLVDFSSCGEPTFASDRKGNCSFTAFEGFDCHLVVTKVGYTKSSIHVDFNKITGIETQYNVYLKRISQFSSGKIKSEKTNQPLGEAFIEVINKNTQEGQSVYSSIDGSFEVFLEPYTPYTLTVEKEGHEKLTQDFTTAGNIPSMSFDVYYLYTQGERSEYMTSGKGILVAHKGDLTVSKDTLAPNRNASHQSNRLPLLVSKGYAVQLASVATDHINFSYFKPLQELGRVYVIQDKGLSKVRLGVYLTQEEASRVVQRVKSFNDFQDAFVIHQTEDLMGYIEVVSSESNRGLSANRGEGDGTITQGSFNNEPSAAKKEPVGLSKEVEKQKVSATVSAVTKEPVGLSKEVEKQKVSATVSAVTKEPEGLSIDEKNMKSEQGDTLIEQNPSEESLYYIRLAAYLDPRYFNPSSIQDIGEIRTFQSGDYTVMLIKGFQSLNSARQAKYRAVDAGFSNAQIVLYKENRLVRVE